MDNLEQPSKVVGMIPNFFYDVISFIIPGASLIIGFFLMWYGRDPAGWPIAPPPIAIRTLSTPAATATLAFGALLLVSLGAASIVGFLLSSLSYSVVERVWGKWYRLNLNGLAEWLGASSGGLELLQEHFRRQFGFRLTDNGVSLSKASFLCSYYIWRVNANLGMMTVRSDAERVSSQSFLVINASLLLEGVIRHSVGGNPLHFTRHDLLWLCLLLSGTAASGLAFNYHRKKRVYARFAMYFALVCGEEPVATSGGPRQGVQNVKAHQV